MFDHDAIFLSSKRGKDVLTLKSNLNDNYVRLSYYNMTCIGFWHANKTDAPFVCMEPQAGFPGRDLMIEDYEKVYLIPSKIVVDTINKLLDKEELVKQIKNYKPRMTKKEYREYINA